jgi:hypothetical protein
MSFKRNPDKAERINRFGETIDLPLFSQNNKPVYNLPSWIWNGCDIKSEVYRSIKNHMSESRLKVLQGFISLGGKATDNEVYRKTGIAVHLVCARRNELIKLGIIQSFPGQKKTGPDGAPNTIWFVNFKKLRELIASEN